MFVEMMLAVFALVIAGTLYASSAEYGGAIAKGPGAIFAGGVSKFLGAIGLPADLGRAYGSVMMIVLAVTIMQLVIRFMRVATSELLSDVSPVFRNVHIGTIIASLLGILLVLTGWWQYLWVLFGGANQLMASLALMLVTAYLMSEGKPAAYAFYPMIFMFFTTIAALIYTSYNLLVKVLRSSEGRGACRKHPDGVSWFLPGYCCHYFGRGRIKGLHAVSSYKGTGSTCEGKGLGGVKSSRLLECYNGKARLKALAFTNATAGRQR
jgi:carbon starvation protein CstA